MALFRSTFSSRPDGHHFTERTRRILAMARDEAGRLHHEYVGTEHLLLAIARDEGGVAGAVLDSLGIDRGSIREMVDRIVQRGRGDAASGPDLPYTSRTKRVLELAMTEARELGHDHVGVEHLLLGLAAEGTGIAAQVLAQHGATPAALREETARILGVPPRPDAPDAPRGTPVVPLPVPPRAGAPAADRAAEALAWARLSHALDVSARLGVAPTLALEDDGSLAVSLGPDLVVSVSFPPDVRLRRRAQDPPA